MNLHQGRLYVYQLLKLLFEEPLNQETLKVLQEELNSNELAQVSSGANSIKIYLESKKDTPPEVLCRELQAEYQRLFVGPGHVLAPIWESVYFDPEGLMFGERTLEVRDFYRKYGLESIHKNRQPEDHLSVELEFILYLIQQYLDSQDVNEQTKILMDQKLFLQQHLGTWKDEFVKLIEVHSDNQFYLGAGMLLREFLDMENEIFEHLKEVS